MGLDMYLNRMDKDMWSFKDAYLPEIFKTKPDLYEALKKYAYKSNYSTYYMAEQVAYWRKANAIHNWFVENVQDGEDNCKDYIVQKENLTTLRDLCKTVIETAVMVPSKVVCGYEYKDRRQAPMLTDGYVIVNKDEISDLLPTVDGFFFGGTGYDNYYMDDIKYTYATLSEIIDKTDWDKQCVYYSSSW